MSDRDPTGALSGQPATLELHRADIGFSAAHFSIIDGESERLHGHNYSVSLRARGGIRDDGTVVDFGTLKRALRLTCADLDERMLIPTESPHLQVDINGDELVVREGARRFVFPRGDVRLLPITNTTCECLATHLLAEIRNHLGGLPVRLEIHVEETPGQGASVAEL